MSKLSSKSLLSVIAGSLLAASAAGAQVTFSTVGSFTGTGCTVSSCTFGGFTLSFMNAASTSYLTPSTLASWIPMIAQSQDAKGCFCAPYFRDGQKNFMTGLLLTALVRYYEEVTPDPLVLQIVRRSADYMWANEWVADSLAFSYVTHARLDAFGKVIEGASAQPPLNGLIATAYAWLYARTRDPKYQQAYDLQLQGLNTNRFWWVSSGKAFDEGHYRIVNSFYWRR